MATERQQIEISLICMKADFFLLSHETFKALLGQMYWQCHFTKCMFFMDWWMLPVVTSYFESLLSNFSDDTSQRRVLCL